LLINNKCRSYFINYVTETREGTSNALGSQFLAGAQAAFAVGRFAGVGIMHFIKPRIVFGIFLTCCIIFIAPAITQHGNTGMAMLFITMFFESICFPTIVALGMRGLGRHTKRGSGWIVGGVVGGAVVPPLMGYAGDQRGMGISMVVPLCFFVAASTYAFAVNFVPWYRDTADAYSETKVGIDSTAGALDEEKGDVASEKGAVAVEERAGAGK
jgi:FHS family L-fucose permease-like MFS transporter